MLIASMIVKAIPEKAEDVAQQLQRLPNVTTYGVHKENNIIVVVEAHDEKELEELSKSIMESYDAVLGVFPTFIGTDEEED